MSKKKIIVIYSIVVVFLVGWLSPFVVNQIVNKTNFYPLELEFDREYLEVSSIAEKLAKILTPEVSSIVIDSRPDGVLNYGKYKLITSRYGYNKKLPTKNSVLSFYQFELKRSKITNSTSTNLNLDIQKKLIKKSVFEPQSETTSALWQNIDDKNYYYAYFSFKEYMENYSTVEDDIDEKYRNSKGHSVVEWVGIYADEINSYVWGIPAGNRKAYVNLTNEFKRMNSLSVHFEVLGQAKESLKIISGMELFGDLSVYNFESFKKTLKGYKGSLLGFMMYTSGDELKLFKQNTEIQLVKLSEPDYAIGV